ncbi:MAG: endolytic transglycosylase MltG [Clostridia bacterium]|nr:endolytic transglycosylase MltG [Clostridia bacterium]
MEETQKKINNKTKIIIIALVAMIVCSVIAFSPYISEYFSKNSNYGDAVVFNVPSGATASDVAKMLEDEGFIKSKYTFIIKYRLNRGVYKNIYQGKFYLNKGMCLNDIMKVLLLTPPETETFTFTVPEGYSIEMIASKCAQMNICTQEEFISAVKNGKYNYEFLNHIPNGNYKYKLEGFLFPSTYEFFEDATPYDIVNKMLAAFEAEYKKNFSNYDNLFENMIIASMVEREAVLDSERAKIAGVIKNRLSEPMKLQIDATVVYAKSNGRYDMTEVLLKDLEVESPYNLYKYEGLTPGPICSPGIKSILAAANPEKHKWLFYHTDEVKKDGSHIFTQTFNEHLSTMN